MNHIVAAVCAGVLMMNAEAASLPTVTVTDTVLNHVSPMLFGQFLERASFGESGPEAATDEHGQVRPDCMALMKRWAPPVIRFPGGTDIDYIDWCDMIDNVPGRDGGRPVTVGHKGDTITNRFGYDEYFALRDTLGCKTIIVLNILDGLAKKKPLAEAVRHAAGLVAYCNAPQGSVLPEGMPDWPAIRARNGHPAPFGAEYIQLGNEWFIDRFRDETSAAFTHEGTVDTTALGTWITEVLTAYVRAVRAVAPDVSIIMDEGIFHGVEERVQSDPYLRREVRYLTMHTYAPMSSPRFNVGDEKVALDALDPAQVYTALSAMPGRHGDDGMNAGFGSRMDRAVRLGYRVCFTEWNWNGWNFDKLEKATGVPWHSAASLGVASFIQGMMRHGAHADIACQSMFLGHGWSIAAVSYNPATPASAHFGAQGRTSLFYREHSGTALLKASYDGIPVLEYPYSIKWNKPHPAALVEPAATRSGDTLFIHLVHRGYTDPVRIRVVYEGENAGTDARLFTLTGRETPAAGVERWLHEDMRDMAFRAEGTDLELAPCSVNCLAVPLKK